MLILFTLFFLTACDPFAEILSEAQDLLGEVGSPPQNHCQDCKEAANPECPTNRYLGMKIVYIGDSHSYLRKANGQRMGNQVFNALNTCGASSITYAAACGSRPRNWKRDSTPKSTCGITSFHSSGKFQKSTKGSLPNLSTLIENNDADLVIINLGDNMFNWHSSGGLRHARSPSNSSLQNEVQSLTKDIPTETQCIWIGPAYHSRGKSYHKSNTEVDKLYEGIKSGVAGKCTLVDSRSFFNQTSPNDGLHLTSSESKHWGEKLASTLKELSWP